jgi:NAD(P)-dependent dehydrogenase (short-subunit alcohol dehydrogenase family)
VQEAVAATVRRFGRLDAVVHCAGLAPLSGIEEMSVEDWHAVLDTNLSSAFYLCKAAWPIFRQQGGGVIVNVSSMAARDPFAGLAAYGAAKAGVNLLGTAAAREGQALGIRVHTVAPGAVETAMFRRLFTPEQFPGEKTLDPADVARVIVQCVQGDLRHSSGEVIYVHKTL